MNTILNAIFILARAQLVDPRSETPASVSIEETGVQLKTFRTHSALDPIAEPLYEPPFVHPCSESEKGMMYGSTSRAARGHFRGSSSVGFTWLSQVHKKLRLMAVGLVNNRRYYFNFRGCEQYVLLSHHGKQLFIVGIIRVPPPSAGSD